MNVPVFLVSSIVFIIIGTLMTAILPQWLTCLIFGCTGGLLAYRQYYSYLKQRRDYDNR